MDASLASPEIDAAPPSLPDPVEVSSLSTQIPVPSTGFAIPEAIPARWFGSSYYRLVLETLIPGTSQHRDAASAVGLAVGLGLLGYGLASPTPGLNVILAVAALIGAMALWLKRAGAAPGEGRFMVPAVVFFAATFAWRDLPSLRLLNGFALAAALALGVYHARYGRLRESALTRYVVAPIAGLGLLSGAGPLMLATRLDWRRSAAPLKSRRVLEVLRGLALAIPLLMVFGGLLASADATFAGLVEGLVSWDIDALFGMIGPVAFYCWLSAAALSALFLPRALVERELRPGAPFKLGAIEVGMSLGALNLLFLAFVAVQIPYLFGGQALVSRMAGLTWADYARRGFFELVTVSALVLPLLLGVHWLIPKLDLGLERLFRKLAGVMIGLLFVIKGSALARMLQYQEAYGMTELRLYTTVFMAWLALVFVWFALTVLRGRGERFAFGALIAGFAALGALNIADPAGMIVRHNVARAAEGKPVDYDYLATLGARSTPALWDRTAGLSGYAQALAARQVLDAAQDADRQDWRSWNWDRARVAPLVAAKRAWLERHASLGAWQFEPGAD